MFPVGSSDNSFPEKMFQILDSESPEVVHWLSHGLAFKVVDPWRFSIEVLPKYFRHNKISSFQRQLNLYGYKKITKGNDLGATFHPSFQRDNRELMTDIKRVAIRSSDLHNVPHHIPDEGMPKMTNVPVSPSKYFSEQVVKAPYKLSGFKRTSADAFIGSTDELDPLQSKSLTFSSLEGENISTGNSNTLLEDITVLNENSELSQRQSSVTTITGMMFNIEAKERENNNLKLKLKSLLETISEKDGIIASLYMANQRLREFVSKIQESEHEPEVKQDVKDNIHESNHWENAL